MATLGGDQDVLDTRRCVRLELGPDLIGFHVAVTSLDPTATNIRSGATKMDETRAGEFATATASATSDSDH